MKSVKGSLEVIAIWFAWAVLASWAGVIPTSADDHCPPGDGTQTCTKCDEPRIVITGTNYGADNIHLNYSNIDNFYVEWVAYSPCGDCYNWGAGAQVMLDGGAGDPNSSSASEVPWVFAFDDDGLGGSEAVHHSRINRRDIGGLLWNHPCQHTLTIRGAVHGGNYCPAGADSYVLKDSNPLTIWIDPSEGTNNSEWKCTNGLRQCLVAKVGKPIDLASGKMYHEMVDLRIDGPLPIEFIRRYESTSTLSGPLGYGWQHNGMIHLENVTNQLTQVFVDQSMRRVAFNCLHNSPSDPKLCGGSWQPNTVDHLTLIQGTAPPWKIVDMHGITYEFGISGTLTKVQDRNGNTLSYSYDGVINGSGQLRSITDSFGRSMSLTYNDDNRIDTVSAGARSVSYKYTGNDLTSVTLADGSDVTYEYSDHRMVSAKDDQGHIIEAHTYSGSRVTRTQSDGGNNDYTINYADPFHPTVMNARPSPVTTTFAIDPFKGVATERTGGPGCSSCGDVGNATYKTYDDHLNVTDIVDGLGTRTHMTYDNDGNVLTRTENCILQNGVCLPNDYSRTTSYTYDAFSLPTTISVPTVGTCLDPISEGPITQRVTKMTRDSANGNLISYAVTGCDRDKPLAVVTSYDYDMHGQVMDIDGPRGANDVTALAYYLDNDNDLNLRGRLHTVTNGAGLITTYSGYDVFGNVGMVTDPNDVQTTFIYDDRDRLRFSRLRAISDVDTDELDVVTEYQYDNVGGLHRLRKPKCWAHGASCEYTFEYQYDGVNRLTEIHDRYGNKITYGYDHEGNRTREEFKDASDATQRVTDFKYDAFNRLEYVCYNPTSSVNCGLAYDHFDYDADGTRLSETDPQDHTTTYEYDDLKRLWKSHQVVGGSTTLTTEYQYDILDGLISVKDPRHLLTTYENDDLGRRRKTTSPDTGERLYDYDEAGNLTTTLDANGNTTARAYDDLNRLLTTTYEHDPDPATTYSYSYDSLDVPFGKGRRTEMTDPSGTTLYGYDRRGLLTSEDKEIDGLTFTTGYDYDTNGNLIELRYPSIDPTTRQGAVDYHYDDADRIDEVSVLYNGEPIDIASNLEYKPFGPRTSMALGNTLLDTRTYDTRYQLGTWVLSNEVPANLLSYTHSFNPDGNLETITEGVPPAHNRSFGYDEIHRLTTATGPWCTGTDCAACSGKTYTYDGNGNRLCKGESATTNNYSYASTSNHLETAGVASFGYDANGNTTSDGTHSYAYNDANRLATVDGTGSYTYDGENRRVRKATTRTTFFFYDPSGRILTEMVQDQEGYGSGDGYGQDYVYMPDAPIARVDWSVIANPDYHHCSPKAEICPPPRIAIADLLYYHTDHLGTPIAMSNQSGELVWKAEYLPFGDLFSNTISTVGNNLRFPGQYFDVETGLHQNWFRDYAPKTGRYAEPDPLGIMQRAVSDATSSTRISGQAFSAMEFDTNLYPYANSSPMNVSDPAGLRPCGGQILCDVARFKSAYDDWFKRPQLGLGQQSGADLWGPIGNAWYCLSGGSKGSSCTAWAVGLLGALRKVDTECCRATEVQRWIPIPHTKVGIECRSDTCKDDWKRIETYDPFWRMF